MRKKTRPQNLLTGTGTGPGRGVFKEQQQQALRNGLTGGLSSRFSIQDICPRGDQNVFRRLAKKQFKRFRSSGSSSEAQNLPGSSHAAPFSGARSLAVSSEVAVQAAEFPIASQVASQVPVSSEVPVQAAEVPELMRVAVRQKKNGIAVPAMSLQLENKLWDRVVRFPEGHTMFSVRGFSYQVQDFVVGQKPDFKKLENLLQNA